MKYLILAIQLLKLILTQKINEVKNEVPTITGLVTTSALNKIPSVSNFVMKTDYDTKINDIEKKITDHKHDEYVSTLKFNKLAADVFNTRLEQANFE